jgi:hypothetical protein
LVRGSYCGFFSPPAAAAAFFAARRRLRLSNNRAAFAFARSALSASRRARTFVFPDREPRSGTFGTRAVMPRWRRIEATMSLGFAPAAIQRCVRSRSIWTRVCGSLRRGS